MIHQMETVTDGVDYLKAYAVTTSSSLEDLKISLNQISSGVGTILSAQKGNIVSCHLIFLSWISKCYRHIENIFQRLKTFVTVPSVYIIIFVFLLHFVKSL